MTRAEAIHRLIKQVQEHHFHHLYRNRRTGHHGLGWSGALGVYSLNSENAANPSGHFDWLQNQLVQITNADGDGPHQASEIANEILEWGGMSLRIHTRADVDLLNQVIAKAINWEWNNPAPMNSGWTKIASIFGYPQGNTIWDSRVSTAVCFRLACLFRDAGHSAAHARQEFPGIGFIPGRSARASGRMARIKEYWRSTYQQWSGHISGSLLMREIAEALIAQHVPCPQFGPAEDPHHPGNGNWTPWKVNMVFFADDVVECATTEGKTSKEESQAKSGCQGFCGHRIINQKYGVHFEPQRIHGPLNDAERLGLPDGAHGLECYRILMEFFRMENGNCKIGARVRMEDPCFEKVAEVAFEAGCPPKKGGHNAADQTVSLFVYPLGAVPVGQEEEAIRNFVCHPDPSYAEFVRLLPEALRVE
jgi:hypothetical protein